MVPNRQLFDRLLRSGERDALSFAGAVGLLVSGVDPGPALPGDPFRSWPDSERLPYPFVATDGDSFPVPRAIRYTRSHWWPHIRAVTLRADGRGMTDWINSADLSAVTELALLTWGDVGSVLAALRPERAPRLTALSLQWTHTDHVSVDDLEQFLDSGPAHGLRQLRISGYSPDVRRVVCRAVGSGRLPDLTALALVSARGLADELLPLADRPVELEVKGVSPRDVVALATRETLAPQVTALTVSTARGENAILMPSASRFVNLRVLNWSLACYDRFAEVFLSALAARGSLTRLELWFETVGPDVTAGAADPPELSSVKELILNHTASFGQMLSDPGSYDVPLARVLSFFAGANPTALGLSQCVWGDASSESLAPLLAGTDLRRLALSACDFGSARALVPPGLCRSLQWLDWSFNKGGWGALEHLLTESGPGLRSLVISNPQGDDVRPAALVRAPALGGLARLSLRACQLRPDDARGLAQHFPPDLLELDLSDNPHLDAENVVALLRESTLDSLLRLELTGLSPGGGLLDFLASWPIAPQLVDLRLGDPSSPGAFEYPSSLLNSASLQFLSPPPPEGTVCSNPALEALEGQAPGT